MRPYLKQDNENIIQNKTTTHKNGQNKVPLANYVI